MQAPLPMNEDARLQALRDYQILDTDAEAEFDDFTLLAAHICGTPMALISLVDTDRQWFKSKTGLTAEETPRDVAFCAHALGQPDLLLVPDALLDPRFADNPLVTGDPNVRFYAGAPLVTGEGYALGTLCVADRVPRTLSLEQQRALQALSRQVIARLDLHRQLRDREKAERELRAGEALKTAILQSALDCIITINQDGRVLEWNPAAERTFGYLKEDAVGRELADLIIPPSLQAAHRRGMGHSLETGAGPALEQWIEFRAVRSDGREFPIELAITPVSLHGETLFTLTLRDISERKRAEQTLGDQEEQYRLLFENATQGLYRTTPDGRILLANRALLEMLGYDSFEQLSARNLEVQGTEAAYERSEFKARLETAGELRGLDATWERRDGRMIFVRENARLVRGSDGIPLYYEGSVEDVTARKEAEEAVRRAHDELEARVEERTRALEQARRDNEMLLNCAGEGLFGLDLDGCTTFVNLAAARMVGWTAEELIGRPMHAVLHHTRTDGSPFPREDCPIYAALRDGTVHHVNDEMFWRKDGTGFPVEYISTPLWEDGRLRGAVVTFQDITSRARAEEALRQSEARYQRIAANLPGTVFQCVIHPDGAMDFPFISEGCRDIYGLEPDQITADPSLILNAFHPEDRDGFYESVAQTVAHMTPWRWEGRIITRSGQTKWMKGVSRSERQANGDIICEGLLRDVSERRIAQDDLRESENRYRSLVDHSPEAIIVYSDSRIVYANAAAVALFAASGPEDLLGRAIFDFVHPDFHGLTRERARRSQEEGLPSGLTQQKYVRLDGRTIDVEAVSTAITYQGKPAGQVLIRDITERLRAEDEVRASKDMLQVVMDNIPQFVFWKDHNSVYLGCNQNFARGAGLTHSEEIIGKTDHDLPWTADEAEAYQAVDRAVMRANAPHLHILETQRQADGREKWLETNKVPLHDSHGNVMGILGTFQDVTERKADEEKIRALNAELFQAYDATIEGWSRALDFRDHETEGHSRRVTELTLRLAHTLGIGGDDLVHIRRGALLHDIGKMGVPDRVLLKPGPLTAEEWELMRRHPALAREMLLPISFLRPALDIPFCHHEKWDGTGYPQCLAGEDIPLAARLFAIVDVWDALRSDRPYRTAWPVPRVLDHIRGLAGLHFDPDVVRAFLTLMALDDRAEGRADAPAEASAVLMAA